MSLFSPHWYRVEELKPKLRRHVDIDRHHYRGERWYVLQDTVNGRFHRFSPSAYYLLSLMDGSRSVSDIWNLALTHLGDEAPDQNEAIQLMAQLYHADLLQADVTPDNAEVFERFTRSLRKDRLSRFMNPMFAKIPLWDPDAFLVRALPFVAPIFTRTGLVLWLAVVSFALLRLGEHWEDVTAPGLAAILDPFNLLVLCVAYPLVKAVHELGHAFATRVWGGEVHEIGIMFLVMVPVPYVDASASSSFGSKHRRMIVGASGVMVELFVASLAFLLWIEIAPGFTRSVLWNVMLIGGVSTLFFNGNPLLRFDGYYVLADWLEIPNLSGRANQYLGYLFQRYVMGLPERRRVPIAHGERGWFVVYGISAWFYRLGVTIGIALFLATRFFVVGVLLATWGLVLQIFLPAVRSLARLRDDPRVGERTARVWTGVLASVTAIVLAVFVVPIPSWTTSEGVVWLPERAQVRAGAAGFVAAISARPGAEVVPGQRLLKITDPLREAELQVLEARLREAQASRARDRVANLVEAEIRDDEIASLEAELAVARQEAARANVDSSERGRFVLPDAADLPGRYVERGDVLGYVAQLAKPTIRTIVSQDDIAAVRDRTRAVSVRLAEGPGRAYPVELDHLVPAATDRLPSMALGAQGGGRLAVDGRDEEGLTTTRNFFQLDLSLASDAQISGIGGRVYVRFDHDAEPLAWRAARSVRRLFLGNLGV